MDVPQSVVSCKLGEDSWRYDLVHAVYLKSPRKGLGS